MNIKKMSKREAASEEKNGHYYRAARRNEELKEVKRQKNLMRNLRHFNRRDLEEIYKDELE